MLRLTFALAVLLSLAFKPVAAQDILAAIANISANDYESRQDVIERSVVFAKKYADVEIRAALEVMSND